jgi:cytochrome o ubiquinol oxidase operon protein cyoD
MKTTTAPGTLLSYTCGFALSVLLTLAAFWVAPLLGTYAAPAIVALAILQLLVQLVFFLHLGQEREARSAVSIFLFTLVIILILIGGTLWIMHDLAGLHRQPETPTDLYEEGVVAPANELH